LRNPIDRLISHYRWLYGYGDEKLDFWTAIKEYGYGNPSYGCAEAKHGYKKYISWGMYGEQIESVLNQVNINNIHILFFDDFISNREYALKGIFKFLKLDDLEKVLALKLNSNESVNLKYKLFYAILRKLNLGLFSKILPNRMKHELRLAKENVINKIKKKSIKEKISLSTSDRARIAEIYKKDVDLLKSLLNNFDMKIPWNEFL
jgi:hypothetical protein